MSTMKAWLIANTEIIYLILQILFTVIMWFIVPDSIGEDGEPTNVGLKIGFVALVITGIFLWSVKSWKASLVIIACFLGFAGFIVFGQEMDGLFSVKLWAMVCVGLAFVLGLILSVAAYRNFEEVVSRRFLYRNSSVSVFEEQLKYAINRFYVGFITVLSFAMEIIAANSISGTN